MKDVLPPVPEIRLNVPALDPALTALGARTQAERAALLDVALNTFRDAWAGKRAPSAHMQAMIILRVAVPLSIPVADLWDIRYPRNWRGPRWYRRLMPETDRELTAS